MKQAQILEALSVFQLDFTIWSGMTKLSISDLKLGEGGDIPPERLALLGRKRICNPDLLKHFNSLKRRAIRTCEKYGLNFLNGYAVPTAKEDQLAQELDVICDEFEDNKQLFLSDYDASLEAWIHENQNYAAAIQSSIMPKEQVAKRLFSGYQLFKIQPSSDASSKRLEQGVDQLGDDLISEVIREADDLYQNLVGKDECHTRMSNKLAVLCDKIDGLSFLHGAILPIVSLMRDVLREVECLDGHKIMGNTFHKLMSLLLLLSDRHRIEQFARGEVSAQAFSTPLPTQPKTQLDDMDAFFAAQSTSENFQAESSYF
ncbi:DUF3150 domain-containing protein [Piscirickettsia litoralis]|uniref:DUF3150 domain-containing protein n=1 Tax=Piscirickettsia litoralis TaxID=1891921 RepID=A0ABX2ZXR6_9GAMM|nr:DUF3150 domain-containing protein [Piscirickettsia litoralis]ODN41372.1 hypothetical protein BGC07_16510 [Piscirickettsia litoralis]